jgi:hypothetical protein
MKYSLIFTGCVTFLFFASCNKPKQPPTPETPPTVTTQMTSGLPSDSRSVNGYFYASASTQTNVSGTQAFVTAFATFSDPRKNLIAAFDHDNESVQFDMLGNVSVGKVRFNNFAMPTSTFFPSSVHYNLSQNFNIFTYGCTWSTEGNGTFKAISETIPGGFPVIGPAISTPTISKSQDLNFDMSSIVTQYDSAGVIISSNFGNSVRRMVKFPDKIVTIKSAELANIFASDTYGTIRTCAFKYSNRIMEDKLYIFELSTKSQTFIQVYP